MIPKLHGEILSREAGFSLALHPLVLTGEICPRLGRCLSTVWLGRPLSSHHSLFLTTADVRVLVKEMDCVAKSSVAHHESQTTAL